MRKQFCTFTATVVFTVAGVIASAKAAVSEVDVVRVVDGDTVVVFLNGKKEGVRLIGIDAPELDQDYGLQAKKTLANLLDGRKAVMLYSKSRRDQYGRILGRIAFRNTDAGLFMIERGAAWYYTFYGHSLPSDWRNAYQTAQANAKYESMGLWEGVGPVPPWSWRKQKHIEQKAEQAAYSESLAGATQELRMTIASIGATMFASSESKVETAGNEKTEADQDNQTGKVSGSDTVIEQRGRPAWWQLFIQLGEAVSRWISAFIKSWN